MSPKSTTKIARGSESFVMRFLFAAPEVALPLGAWSFTLVAAWARFPLIGVPYGSDTFLLVLACLAGALVPPLFVTEWSRPLNKVEAEGASFLSSDNARIAWILSVVGLGISVALYIYTFRMLMGSGLDLEDYRVLKGVVAGESTGRLGQMNYVFMAIGTVSCYLVNRIKISETTRLVFGIFVVGSFILIYLSVGTRTEFLVPVLTFFVSYVIFRYPDFIRRVRTMSVLFTLLVALLIAGNAALSAIGARGGYFGASSQAMGGRGAKILQGLGVQDPGDNVSVMFGYIDEYLLSPMYYLDFYLNVAEHEAAWGATQFDFVARRLGYSDRFVIKTDVDALYSDLDLEWNVWATGIRELAIDFGKDSVIVTFACFGAILALAKKTSRWSLGGGLIYTLLTTFLLLSPALSLMKSRYMQFGLYIGLLWWLIDLVRPKGDRATRYGSLRSPGRLDVVEGKSVATLARE